MKKLILVIAISFISVENAFAQVKGNDVTTPLHALKVDYPVPYEAPTVANVKKVLDRVLNYLDAVTPAQMINKKTGEVLGSIDQLDTNASVKQGDFRLTSYEWGVTYSAMQRASETTGDSKYADYAKNRFNFLATWVSAVKAKFPIEYIQNKKFFA